MLKKGDPCYVRLMSGKVFEANYDEYTGDKQHFVKLKDGRASLTQVKTDDMYDDDDTIIPDCRFVCMTGLNKGKEK